MLNLDTKITLNKAAIESSNLCDRFSSADLRRLGEWVWAGYNRDKHSRVQWEKRTQAAMDLALQLQKDKNFPWPGCSNIAFPLVTIAVLQFHSRAYPAIINGTRIVKARVVGPDPSGKKRERADRVSTHMSWQVLEEDRDWEEQHDRLLINLPCVGSAFVKSYYSTSKGYNESELVLAKDLVLDYWAKSVEECPRKTHIIPLFRNDLHERIARGTFRDVSKESWYQEPAAPQLDPQTIRENERKGIKPPQTDETTPFIGLEQHCEVDLDGDGYAEPYIITIEETSKDVLRIVTGFDREADIERVGSGPRKGEIIKIHALQYFTKYGFIPSPDGGIYDIGFGILLGPLNEATNSLINQLVDTGTMSNTAGGFLGRGAKIRGGVYTFAPLEWKRVDSTGDDLRKSIFPLPVREPSKVLFQLLSLLINYTNRVSGSTDIMVGENPGQNTPAETSRTMVVQGEKIYSAIFKRVWRSMKEEFKKLYILNGIHLDVRTAFGNGGLALKEDYLGNPDDVVPAADPNITSDEIQLRQAVALKQSAATTPGYDLAEVEHRYLTALKVEGIDKVFPGPGKVPPLPNFKLQIEQLKQQGRQMEMQQDMQRFAAELMEQQRVNNAKIIQLQAQAAKLLSEVKNEDQRLAIAAIDAQIGAFKAHNEAIMSQVDRILKAIEIRQKGAEDGDNKGAVRQLAAGSSDAGASAGAGA